MPTKTPTYKPTVASIGGRNFKIGSKRYEEEVSAGGIAAPKLLGTARPANQRPVSVLSSKQGQNVVDTTITPAISQGMTAAAVADQNRMESTTESDPLDDLDIFDDEETSEEGRLARLEKLADKQFEQEQKSYRQLSLANTDETSALIGSLQSAWATARKAQLETNKSTEASLGQVAIRTGISRYAPTLAATQMEAQRTYGIEKLTELDGKYSTKIAEANAELRRGNLQNALNASKAAREYLDEAMKTARENIEEAQKLSRQTRIDAGVGALLDAGVVNPNDIMKRLKAKGLSLSSKEVADTIENLTAEGDESTELLSVEEARKLGVPFGTTKGEAYGTMAQTSGIEDLTPSQLNASNSLRDDYNTRSKDFFTVKAQKTRIDAAARNPTPAGDLSLIFAYMKMLDPTSVVREGEFATAQNAGSVPDRIINQYNAIVNGGKLGATGDENAKLRADFVERARLIYEAEKAQQEQRNRMYASRAERLGIPADLVIEPLDLDDMRTPEEKLQELYDSDPETAAKINQIEAENPNLTPQDMLDILDGDTVSMSAESLATAIAMAETGNKPGTKGASGENGAFQFLPPTWAAISREVTGKVLPMTPENERKVAVAKIDRLLRQGNTPEEVALIWNTSLGGSEEPRRIAGVNKQGVKYDSVAYAKKVMSHLRTS